MIFFLYIFELVTDNEFRNIQCDAGMITNIDGGTRAHKTVANTLSQ
jgi:hypothetical protein